MTEKELVRHYWNEASCGEELYLTGAEGPEKFNNQMQKRYELEPYILDFADFEEAAGKKVLEVGVGLGADHQKFAESGAHLLGCDLTERAIEHTASRLKMLRLQSDLQVADAEDLPYPSDTFDIVFSWGVIHHSPDTPSAVSEIWRVLKPGGVAKVMIYHKHSFVGYMLWLRYGLLAGKPFTSLDSIYSRYLESPGTKAYTVDEAEELFDQYSQVSIETVLTHGDLLSSDAGQRHQGTALNLARRFFPRRIIKALFPRHGLFMLIKAQK